MGASTCLKALTLRSLKLHDNAGFFSVSGDLALDIVKNKTKQSNYAPRMRDSFIVFTVVLGAHANMSTHIVRGTQLSVKFFLIEYM